MKTGTSSLNPYAASYIPLSRRGAMDENNDYKLTAKDSKNGNETIWSGQNQHQSKESQNYNIHGTGILPLSEDFTLKAHRVHGSYGSSSHNLSEMTQKQILDEEFDMDLAYLQMTFPGISDGSLSDVYAANKGDLEATVDMLSQLELYTVDSSEILPDTLDIGDVSEPGSSSEAASLKLKKVEGEVGGSSSGSSNSPHVT
uniref:Putative polyadenylate-binding protein-interacting protein n=1 Tax=Davidia involucrata TaxID=16924 RepID=A0A5B7C3F4_DAVIN